MCMKDFYSISNRVKSSRVGQVKLSLKRNNNNPAPLLLQIDSIYSLNLPFI